MEEEQTRTRSDRSAVDQRVCSRLPGFSLSMVTYPIHHRKAANREHLARRQRFKDGLDQSFGTASTSGTSTPTAVASPRPAHALPVTTSSGRPVSGTSRVASSVRTTSSRASSSASANAVIDVTDLDDDDDVSSTATGTRSGSEARAGQRRRIDGGEDGSTQGRRVKSRLSENVHSASGNDGNGSDGGNGLIILD